jgi:DNA mismatch repair protein MutL
MGQKGGIPSVRILPEEIANKIAAGEVVERPASVVKELIENALDARATRLVIRLVGAGRRTIEVVDNGHGMSEQDALLAIERHATSKIRRVEDLDNITTLGFRGEALASIASVSRFEMVTRRAKDEAGTRIWLEGGTLRENARVAAPVGTRVAVHRLYFNTPARAKFLKGIATELSHAVDIVQRHALAHVGVGFQCLHNDKVILDIPDQASLRERIALIWGLSFLDELVEVEEELADLKLRGLIGTPGISRSQRSHQFFFLNARPVVNRALQYGFEEGYRELLTVGRHPVGILLIETHPRFVDVNVHPTKREIRFRDERAAREALREMVRRRLGALIETRRAMPQPRVGLSPRPPVESKPAARPHPGVGKAPGVEPAGVAVSRTEPVLPAVPGPRPVPQPAPKATAIQTEFAESAGGASAGPVRPQAVYESVGALGEAPLQVFGTYLLVPEQDRLLIIDQHALHERLTYDSLRAELDETDYEAQRLAVPLLIDVPPSHTHLLESHMGLFSKLGIDIEPFGGNTYQVTAVCHLYEDSKIADAVCRVLDALAQGDLFDKQDFMSDLLRLTVAACRGAVKAGDSLSPQERRGLLEGFRRIQPPYTCPHGRPIITELTLVQMEKSFRRRQ